MERHLSWSLTQPNERQLPTIYNRLQELVLVMDPVPKKNRIQIPALVGGHMGGNSLKMTAQDGSGSITSEMEEVATCCPSDLCEMLTSQQCVSGQTQGCAQLVQHKVQFNPPKNKA